MEWQPIETAPKDGTEILMYSPMIGTAGPSIDIGEWWKDGWYHDWPADPTHWMPLPPPPSPSPGGA